MLPIVLEEEKVEKIFEVIESKPGIEMTVNLQDQQLSIGDLSFAFDVEPFRKHCLINGLDDIAMTLQHAEQIKAFEANRLAAQPWLNNSI